MLLLLLLLLIIIIFILNVSVTCCVDAALWPSSSVSCTAFGVCPQHWMKANLTGDSGDRTHWTRRSSRVIEHKTGIIGHKIDLERLNTRQELMDLV